MTTPDHDAKLSRRGVLLRGIGGLALLSGAGLFSGCSSSSKRAEGLPGIRWPEQDQAMQSRSVVSTPRRAWHPLPEHELRAPTGVISRAQWAKGDPVPMLMDRMQPVRRITIHHDGMTPFVSTSQQDAALRLELIRTAHRGQQWGDIGYHYVIDPAGRVWQARPLAWQGAHVKNQNEGNLGICVLGNYEQQRLNPAQQQAIEQFVASQMRQYRVPVRSVVTHQELAPTACPGRDLQAFMIRSRGRSGALAMV